MITVYIDVLFMVNFMINILIVEGTGVILAADTKYARSLLAALTGAVYAALVFFIKAEFAQSVVMKLLLSAVMVLIAFGFKGRVHFLKMWGSFFVVSFIFGGSLFALMSATGLGSSLGMIYSNGEIYLNLPWKWVLLSASGTYFLIYVFGRIRKKRIATQSVSRTLTIYTNGTKTETTAIIDTGNSLFDPITGAPVIVCERGELETIVPQGEALMEKMCEAGLKVRLIPFSSIGKADGLMPAFLPDMVKIDGREAKGCLIGVTESRLCKENEYHALLNPAMLVK
ncbi:MAG: sigma-E processing peptidase SpoIIGA [Clostridia bacterium]|nr:sigma-E processing peptidase SpoIIGA [Clostridia bacterium]